MDKENSCQTWVGNIYQRFEAVCHEVDEFVNKDTVKYVENHMQTVGESVKKFYSDVVQDILPPLVEPVQHVADLIPSKQIDLVETYTSSVVDIKENTIDRNTNKSEEGPLVPTEKCHELSITGLRHSEQIDSKISGCPVGDADSNLCVQNEGPNLINKTSDTAIQVHLNSSTSSQENFVVERSSCKDVSSPKHKKSSEAFIYSGCINEKCDDDHSAKISHEPSKNHLDNRSSEVDSESSVFEDADWGIEDIIDLKSTIDKEIEGEPSPSEGANVLAHRILFDVPFDEEKSEKVSMETFEISYPQEKDTLLNRSIDEFKSDSNTSSIHQSSKLESSITCDENNEENASHVFNDDCLPPTSYDSSSSTFRNSLADPDIIYSNSTELMDSSSVSSHSLSSCKSIGATGHDNNDDSTRLASCSYALSDDTTKIDEVVSGTGLCRSDHCCYNNLAQFETTVSCSEIGAEEGSMVDVEYFNMDTIDLSDKKQFVESCVIVKGENLCAFPSGSRRSKSYKKIIQDAFTSRKRLTQEYKQLAIWYGDIDKEFSQLTVENTPPNIVTTPKPPAQDLPDSEWELL